MAEPTESMQQLKARIQRQLLESIAELSDPELESGFELGQIVNTYAQFMSVPTVTFAPDGVEGESL